jgi:alpha-galactosidase
MVVPSVIQLRSAGVAVILDVSGPDLPVVLHWGADLGDDPHGLLEASAGVRAFSALDTPMPVRLLPEPAQGFAGRPGLQVVRPGASSWSPRFVTESVETSGADGGAVVVHAHDARLGLRLRTDLLLEPAGLLRLRHEVTNAGPGELELRELLVTLPVPEVATELLDLTGRWCRERSPQRRPFHQGALVRESRRGRTGHDASLLLAAGTDAFGFRRGEVWAVHVAWSGDHVSYAERLPEGHSVIGGGELLAPGEIVLAEGETYSSPWLLASWSPAGLDCVSHRFHRWLRSRHHHPRRARPVLINTWEAVYFAHDLDALRDLADVAAATGLERFVLDDGWFRGRRHDEAGLGDWTVDRTVWPDGLHPIVEHVRGLGMEFGLWVEPEMVNEDSDLLREHPEWALRGRDEMPPPWRHQQVLDLQVPEAYAHVRDALDALLREYDIACLKWDHNRDLVDAAHSGAAGVRPAVHGQTRAVYRLLDELRALHPHLEIESCASGGARVDAEILQRTDRVWASDCNDPLERQMIQRWTSLLVPPELMGSHVAAPQSHTTGRTHSLDFRAVTALFGHFGVEWDLREATQEDRARLAAWIEVHKDHRDLLATGDVVHSDHGEDLLHVHGLVSPERDRALLAVVQTATSPRAVPGRVRLPGLDRRRVYQVFRLGPEPVWASMTAGWAAGPGAGLSVSGAVLTDAGLALPGLRPESAVLLGLTAQT